MTDEATKREYRQAYEDWQTQLVTLHRVLLEGQRLVPPRLKGLLNREARAKERYETARRRLLGIADEQTMAPRNMVDDARDEPNRT